MKEHLPYSVLLPITDANRVYEIQQWCHEHCGKRWQAIRDGRDGVWTCFWNGQFGTLKGTLGYVWHFKNESDAVLFSLKWS